MPGDRHQLSHHEPLQLGRHLYCASGLGEYLDVDDPLWGPSAVQLAAQHEADARTAQLGPDDVAELASDNHYTVTRNGEVVGYIVAIELVLDDPGFEGGGNWLYSDPTGRLIENVPWSN